MEKTLITVVVPVYNVAPYLGRCIESILGQTYGNLEIILVDDGSTDASGKICDEYAAADKRIKVVHKENGGLVTARKAGLAIARGAYIGFVDSDDYIEPEFYELLFKNMVENGSDISQTGYLAESGDGTQKVGCAHKVFDMDGHRIEMLCEGLLEQRRQGFCIFYNVWSKLYRADLARSCYARVPDVQQFGEDLICTCLCMLCCNKISTIDCEPYHYTVRGDSMSNEKSLDYFVNYGNLYSQLKNVFKDHPRYMRIRDAADVFYKTRITDGLEMLGAEIQMYAFPGIDLLRNKSIILYGAGRVGRDYYSQLCKYKECRITAFMDRNYDKYHYDCIDVIGKDRLPDLEYDLILISVLKEETALSVKADLAAAGVSEGDIIWERPNCCFWDGGDAAYGTK